MQHYTEATRAIVLRLRRTRIHVWLLDDDERDHVETSLEWRREYVGGTLVVSLRGVNP